jgi:predicted RecB family nuclease
MRLTPTDVSQFVRLDQCERFLRFRLAERAGQDFMKEYEVHSQRITPLLSLSGQTFEDGIEADLSKRLPTTNFAVKYGKSHNRPANNTEVVEAARKLLPGQTTLLFQPRLEAELSGWLLRGDVDLLRLERTAEGTLHILIGDMKSTVEVKVEHRLQVAFYRLMFEAILKDASVSHSTVQTGILFRPPADPTPEDEEEIKPLREAAKLTFGLSHALLEVVADPEAYLQSANDLVLGKDSTVRRVAGTPFEAIPYSLCFKCDGCLYNEFCMKWSAEKEDLSLIPYMTGTDKEAMRRIGVMAQDNKSATQHR